MKPPVLRYVLKVVAGPDRGAGVHLGLTPLVVGRSHTCGLRLTDPGVSRSHLAVVATENGVQVTATKPACAFLVQGALQTSRVLRPGDVLEIGATHIAIAAAVETDSAAPESEAVRSLMLSRATLDAPALAALVSLLESLDAQPTEEAVLGAVLEWVRRHRLAQGLAMEVGPPPAHADADALGCFTRPLNGATEHWLPLEREHEAWLVLRSHDAPESSPSVRALLVIAAELVSSALRQRRRLAGYRAERAARWNTSMEGARGFLGSSVLAREVADKLTKFAVVPGHVLLLGESGVGKTLAARLLHEQSPRGSEPLVELNCAAIPPNLLEAELFGHERGAFTDAVEARAGAFADAGDGTVFLDEVGELPLEAQAKLLRALDERTFLRLGSRKPTPLRARVVAATNRPLAQLVASGGFREDLYFRLSVLRIEIPSLRARKKDIPTLAAHLLDVLCKQVGRAPVTLAKAAEQLLLDYEWPGNVRELRNVLERALALHDGPTLDEDALDVGHASRKSEPKIAVRRSALELPMPAEALEQHNFEAAQRKCKGDAARMAEALHVSRMTVYRWQEKNGLR